MAEFELTLRDGIDWGYDRPSERAIEVTTGLLRELALHPRAAEGMEFAIGVDGGIELDTVRGDEMFIVMIPPSGDRIDMAVKNWRSRELTCPTQTVTANDVVMRIEQAA